MKVGEAISRVWCVRATAGNYTEQFVQGGYAAIGWMPDVDLSTIGTRDKLYPLYKEAYPDETSDLVVGQQVGQIARFLLELKAGDHVITPAVDSEFLYHGTVEPGDTTTMIEAMMAALTHIGGALVGLPSRSPGAFSPFHFKTRCAQPLPYSPFR